MKIQKSAFACVEHIARGLHFERVFFCGVDPIFFFFSFFRGSQNYQTLFELQRSEMQDNFMK
jgi:hypothetical protein